MEDAKFNYLSQNNKIKFLLTCKYFDVNDDEHLYYIGLESLENWRKTFNKIAYNVYMTRDIFLEPVSIKSQSSEETIITIDKLQSDSQEIVNRTIDLCKNVDEYWSPIYNALKRVDSEEIRHHASILLHELQDQACYILKKCGVYY